MIYPTAGITNYPVAVKSNSFFSVLPFIDLHKHTTQLTMTFLEGPLILGLGNTIQRAQILHRAEAKRMWMALVCGEALKPANSPCGNKRHISFCTNSITEPMSQKEREGLAMKAERRNWGNSSYRLSKGVRNTDRESKPYDFFKIL